VFAEREVRGRQRLLAMGEQMQCLWSEHCTSLLAQFYMSKIQYDPDLYRRASDALRALTDVREFMP
jgi:hypothetical protein